MKFIIAANFLSQFDLLEDIFLSFREEESDGIIFAGDLTTSCLSREKVEEEMESFWEKLDRLGIPMLTIPGNNEFNEEVYFIKIFELYRKLINLSSLQEYLFFYTNIVITGFGGLILDEVNKKIHPLHYTPSKLFFGVRKVMFQKEEKVLVLHTPPENILDMNKKGKHLGHPAVNKLIQVIKPSVCVVGHADGVQGEEKLGETLIIHPGNLAEGQYAVLDWDTKKVTFR